SGRRISNPRAPVIAGELEWATRKHKGFPDPPPSRPPRRAAPSKVVPPREVAAVLRGRRLSSRQVAAPHQVLVDRTRGLAAFADRPHHERLPAAHIARGEHLVGAGLVAAG